MLAATARREGNHALETIAVLVLVAGAVWIWFLSPGARNKRTVSRVGSEYQEIVKRLKVPPNATPSQRAWVMDQFGDAVERVDVSGCPDDFQAASRQFVQAVREFAQTTAQYPDNFLEALQQGGANFLVRGEVDGGQTRLDNAVERARKRCVVTMEELRRVGQRYDR